MVRIQKGAIPTRQSLLVRLEDWDDQKSWQDFFDTYWKLIYGVARKSGLREAEAQDVVQEVVIQVCKKMKSFKYDPALGSFKGWLLHLTRWRVADQFRKRKPPDRQERPEADHDRRTATVERIPDPAGFDVDSVWDREWRKNLVDAAIAKVRRKASPRQYQIFDCYVLKEWPAKRVAKTLGVNVGQVYLAKHRVGALIKRELENTEEWLP